MRKNFYPSQNSVRGFLLTMLISFAISLCCVLNVSASINSPYYKVRENNTIVIAPAVTFQQLTVTGVVTDASTGEALIGVSVMVEGTTTGGITDVKGNFKIEAPNRDAVLVFTYIGYLPERVTLGEQSTLNIKLSPDIKNLDEIVVIGYGTVRKKDLTGAVSSVGGDQLRAIPAPNIAQAMQGKLPGVNITSQDGRPDATVSIRVRGGTSISQSNDPLILVDGITVSSLSDIPADQVERVDVLKDAASTAIYGSRGANGVVLVTTKRAKEGKTSVTYNSYVKFNTPVKYLKTLNPYDYLKYVWANATANGSAYVTPFEKLYGLGANAGNNTGGLESYRNLGTDDIQKKVYKNSVSMNHDLSISGGTDKTKMLFSSNYLDDEGMKLNSYSKRANISFKVDQKVSKNIDLMLDTRYTDLRNLDDEGTTNGSGSLLSYAYRFRPIKTAHILGDLAALKQGNMEQYGKTSSWDTYSPVARISDYDPLSIKQTFRGAISLNWLLIKGLTYHTDFSMTKGWNQNKKWSGAIYNNYIDDATGAQLWAGAVDYEKSDSWGLRWTNTLKYDLNLSTIQKIDFLVGQEVTNSGGNNMRITANHFPANFSEENAYAMIDQYDKVSGTSSFSTSVSNPDRLLSFFGRVNYSLLDRYLVTFTLRTDASSRFLEAHNVGYFPAAAFAWRMSEEPFMKDIHWLDNLKLRFSYGQAGNNGIPSGVTLQTWTSATDRRFQYVINNQYQSAYDFTNPTIMANKNLKWETNITRNLGVDYSFLNNRLLGTIDIYENTTKDLLLLTGNPAPTGFPFTYDNIGQTTNKGLELSLTGIIFKNKDWDIEASANVAFNKSNVDKLGPNATPLYGTSWASSGSYPAADYILQEGSSVGLVRGLIYDGFYTTNDFDYANGVYTLKQGVPDVGNFIGPLHGVGNTERPTGQIAYPGVVKYKNLNGDNVIDDKDLTVIGDMNPISTGGFNFNVSYKNIDLGVYFNWSYGNKLYNLNKLGSLYGYKEAGVYENKLAIVNNTYKIYDIVDGQVVKLSTPDQLDAANTNASLPLAYNENGVTSTLGIEDGSYLRINTLTLGYSLPQALLKKARIANLRIYGSIYNVLTTTGYSGLDPEVNTNTAQNKAIYPTTGLDWGAYPRARSFVVGVNLGF